MASILETLARVGVEKVGPVTDILSRGYMVPYGVSSIYFAYNTCHQTRSARTFMKHRNIPIRFVVAQKSNDLEITDGPREEETFYLDNILIPENRKR